MRFVEVDDPRDLYRASIPSLSAEPVAEIPGACHTYARAAVLAVGLSEAGHWHRSVKLPDPSDVPSLANWLVAAPGHDPAALNVYVVTFVEDSNDPIHLPSVSVRIRPFATARYDKRAAAAVGGGMDLESTQLQGLEVLQEQMGLGSTGKESGLAMTLGFLWVSPSANARNGTKSTHGAGGEEDENGEKQQQNELPTHSARGGLPTGALGRLLKSEASAKVEHVPREDKAYMTTTTTATTAQLMLSVGYESGEVGMFSVPRADADCVAWIDPRQVKDEGQQNAQWRSTWRASDLPPCRLTTLLKVHEGPVMALGWSPDGKRGLSGGIDGKGTFLLITSRVRGHGGGGLLEELVVQIIAKGSVRAPKRGWFDVTISPDGRHAVAGGGDGRIWVVDMKRREVEAAFEQSMALDKGSVASISISQDSRRFICGGRDGTVTVWDVDATRATDRVR